jgi:DNA-binding LacI/PurR family transcriptional regulator
MVRALEPDERLAPPPATSFDVARLAGVSRSAVSRAFTPGASISAGAREKVLKAAADTVTLLKARIERPDTPPRQECVDVSLVHRGSI